MNKAFVYGLMTVGLFATNVQAETIHCHSIKDCRKLKAEVEADLAELLGKSVPKFTEILEFGVSQYEAEKICQKKGLRLPTAREFALFAQSLGAMGISSVERVGFRLVKGSDSKGKPDHFYFNRKGYNPYPDGRIPEDDEPTYLYSIWTSSVLTGESDRAYRFDEEEGDMIDTPRAYDRIINGVRCVQAN